MNRDIIEGNWKQLKGKAKVQWGKAHRRRSRRDRRTTRSAGRQDPGTLWPERRQAEKQLEEWEANNRN